MKPFISGEVSAKELEVDFQLLPGFNTRTGCRWITEPVIPGGTNQTGNTLPIIQTT